MGRKRAGESKTSIRRLEAVKRQEQALQYRIMGATLAQIAEKLGYATAQGAACAIESALKRTLQEPADAVRELELTRLDTMLLGLWPAASKGDIAAIGAAMQIMNRRARYLGLDAPEKREVTGKDGAPLQAGVMIVPAPIEPDVWAAGAAEYQRKIRQLSEVRNELDSAAQK